jgi:hypothetical protein
LLLKGQAALDIKEKFWESHKIMNPGKTVDVQLAGLPNKFHKCMANLVDL